MYSFSKQWWPHDCSSIWRLGKTFEAVVIQKVKITAIYWLTMCRSLSHTLYKHALISSLPSYEVVSFLYPFNPYKNSSLEEMSSLLEVTQLKRDSGSVGLQRLDSCVSDLHMCHWVHYWISFMYLQHIILEVQNSRIFRPDNIQIRNCVPERLKTQGYIACQGPPFSVLVMQHLLCWNFLTHRLK